MPLLSPRRRLPLVLALVLLGAGCGTKPNVPQPPAARAPAAPTRLPKDAITDIEIDLFGAEFEEAASGRKGDDLTRLIDWDRIIANSVEAMNVAPALQKQYRDRVHAIVGNRFEKNLFENLDGGVNFAYLHAIRRDGSPRAIFRMDAQEEAGALDYLELTLERTRSGRVQAIEIEGYLTGEKRSILLARMLAPALAAETQPKWARMFSKPSPWVEHGEALKSLRQLSREGRIQESFDIYKRLPESLKKDVLVQIHHVHLAEQAGAEAQLAALEEFRRLCPESTAIELLNAKYYRNLKQIDRLMACYDRIERRVGGDPYLDFCRAEGYLSVRDLPHARAAIDRAALAYPDDIDICQTQTSISLLQRRFSDARAQIHRMVTHLDFRLPDLTKLEAFTEFVKSPEYARLLQSIPESSREPQQPPTAR